MYFLCVYDIRKHYKAFELVILGRVLCNLDLYYPQYKFFKEYKTKIHFAVSANNAKQCKNHNQALAVYGAACWSISQHFV